MRSLNVGVYAEGPTDHEFLTPLIQRLAVSLIEDKGHHAIDVAEPISFPGRPSSDVFRDAMIEHVDACHLVVVHTDGAGQPENARADRIDPWFESVRDLFDDRRRSLVAAVPVKETEAWMLCDTSALNTVLGTGFTREQFELPHPHEVESLSNPKAALDRVHLKAAGVRQARKVGRRPLYRSIGLVVAFDALVRIPAFQRFRDDFEASLRAMTYLPA